MLSTVSFRIKSGNLFQPIQLRPYFVLQNDFIWLGVLNESCSPGCIDKLGFLNCLISILETQDIPVWISSMKVENPAARMIMTRVCRSDSRSK